ncbi:GTP 3',8-cyclase MoaA [Sphingopyxis macrogoltabida]|uniref:GTP 3',8-cyclase n=1 Tax=Sphingopyxis macrogoltabida TaxID=33050 RepID=A0AAC9FG26_SPHMC|nr:GTP 3',8-cyclase MoaA [Sphingopyxis macrogoltabida]ALJ14823.1 molybdenum cofactor biosynthesis protein MoaA [Sphingopyxis macrogoltabida]AMU91076.1 cyclic pyranopterin phosphate synthase MoaA [Sphingopyxis macrogoltabida]
MSAVSDSNAATLTDGHGRRITYLRLSVTDRCDLRCRYCMAEHMSFLPRSAVLSIEEMAELAERFVARGIRRIRLTGGEPLVRRGIDTLATRLGAMIGHGLDELTLTTNGMRLAEYAPMLAEAGVRRINVSLDTLDPDTFRHITRVGDVAVALQGIAAARAAGLDVKINMVALAGLNEDQLLPMLDHCAAMGCDLTLIETMPLGEIGEDRSDHYIPLHQFVAPLRAERFIYPVDKRTGGPARYFAVEGSPVTLGLITPLSDNFCATCNRIRLTVEGRIYMCLGQDDHIDLRAALRDGGIGTVDGLIDRALAGKPRAHDFHIERESKPAVARHMSATGG